MVCCIMEHSPTPSDEAIRKIIHVDMDAFFASVEQRDHPEWRGKPIAVGGSAERGVVAAASYEARKYGVRSAMPSITAKRLCPNLIFVPHRFDVYREVSQQVMAIFREYTDLVEPLSLDEAYLDVTSNKMGMPSATIIAREIRARIQEETQLTASAGISFNKFLAKSASDVNKPDGITVITPKDADAFIDQLKIEQFFGVGKVTATKMKQLGIFSGANLKTWSEVDLVRNFGKSGRYYYRIVRGLDDRPVKPDRIRKSVSAEDTFESDLSDPRELSEALNRIVDVVLRRLAKNNTLGRTVTVKIKFNDFTIKTRSRSSLSYITDPETIRKMALELLATPDWPSQPVRLLGAGLSNLNTEKPSSEGLQLTLNF